MLKNDFGQPGDGTLKFKVFEEWIDEIYIYIYIYFFFAVFDKDSKTTKRLEICIDINIEISEVDHYTEAGGGGTNKSGRGG